MNRARPERRSGVGIGGERLVFAGVLLILLALPWPWGAASAGAKAALGATVCALALLRVSQRPDWRSRVQAPLARLTLALWLSWLGWVALQVVPLPRAVLRVLSPGSAQAHEALATAAAVSPLSTISVAPGASIGELLLSASYILFYWLVLVGCISLRRRMLVLASVALAGLLQALYGGYMAASGLEYGFFARKAASLGVASGTFVDRDHFAAYLELALAAAVGLMLAAAQAPRRLPHRPVFARVTDLLLSHALAIRVVILVLVVGLVLSRSRMGNAAFAAGLGVGAPFYLALRKGNRRLALLLFGSIALLDVAIVSDRFGLGVVVERLQQTSLKDDVRPLVLKQLLPLAAEYEGTGAGLGAFGNAFGARRPPGLDAYFDHAHNEYAEFLIEAGIPGLAILAALMVAQGWHCIGVVWRRNSPAAVAVAFAALLAMVCIGIHATTDFMLRVPAVAMTLLALCAAGMSVGATSSQKRRAGEALPASIQRVVAEET